MYVFIPYIPPQKKIGAFFSLLRWGFSLPQVAQTSKFPLHASPRPLPRQTWHVPTADEVCGKHGKFANIEILFKVQTSSEKILNFFVEHFLFLQANCKNDLESGEKKSVVFLMELAGNGDFQVFFAKNDFHSWLSNWNQKRLIYFV